MSKYRLLYDNSLKPITNNIKLYYIDLRLLASTTMNMTGRRCRHGKGRPWIGQDAASVGAGRKCHG